MPSTDDLFWKDIAREFPACREVRYLNTGTIGIMPRSVLSKTASLAYSYYLRGPARVDVSSEAYDAVNEAKKLLANLMGCEEQDLAFMVNTTEGINAVLMSIPWNPGDVVITSDTEHPAVKAPLAYLEIKKGVKIVTVPAKAAPPDEASVEKAFREAPGQVKAVVMSHVSYTTGMLVDLSSLARVCHRHGAVFLVDGAQFAGAGAPGLRETGVDAYAFPGYKWLLGPEGTGGLYLAPSLRERIEPSRAFPHSIKWEEGSPPELGHEAEAYQTSTPPVLNYAALGWSVAFLLDIGMDRVAERCRTLARIFKEQISSIAGFGVVTPTDPGRSLGLVSFTINGFELDDYLKAVEHLYKHDRVVIRAVSNPPALRASFHLYNTEEDVRALVWALKNLKLPG